jgi:hypothetical protein
MDNITDLSSLKKSPMFQLSLSSKELFHSNFLAWLGIDADLRQVFKSLMIGLGIKEAFVKSWKDNFEVLREKDHLDLIVKARDISDDQSNYNKQTTLDSWYVVIENKIKSIPNDKQLESYSTKCGNCQEKLLLVISGEPMPLNYGWRRVNYTQVVKALESSMHLVSNSYKKAIIADYVDMLKYLINIIECQEVSMESNYIYNPTTELKELRIADLVDKWRAAKISKMYEENTDFEFNVGYTDAQSLIETYVPLDNIELGIQIQGRQYRRCIIGNIKDDAILNICKGFLFETRSKFREKMNSEYPNIFDTEAVKGEQNKPFCSYNKNKVGKTFWYQYVVIREDATIEQIMECVVKDRTLAENILKKQ